MITTYRGFFIIHLSDFSNAKRKLFNMNFLLSKVRILFYIPNIIRWIKCKKNKEHYYNFYGIPVTLYKCIKKSSKRNKYDVYKKSALDLLSSVNPFMNVNQINSKFIILKRFFTMNDASLCKTARYYESTELDFDNNYFVLFEVFNNSGEYIGDPEFALYLYKKGINPEKSHSTHSVCSIGFCPKEQKWYGWSHRAFYGFGIGSSVTKESIAYVPSNKEDYIKHMCDFWDSSYTDIRKTRKGFYIKNKQRQKNGQIVSNLEKFEPFPKTYGKGVWTAKTLDDAKHMAIDFANNIS